MRLSSRLWVGQGGWLLKGVKVLADEAAWEREWHKASALWSRRLEVKLGRRGGCAAAAVSRAQGSINRRSPSFVLSPDRRLWCSGLFGNGENIDGGLKDWSSSSRRWLWWCVSQSSGLNGRGSSDQRWPGLRRRSSWW